MTMEPKNYGRTVNGELITEEFIEKLSREAEKGWDVEELLTWRVIHPDPEPAPDAHAPRAPSRRPRRRR
jgi:hypothetical protein